MNIKALIIALGLGGSIGISLAIVQNNIVLGSVVGVSLAISFFLLAIRHIK